MTQVTLLPLLERELGAARVLASDRAARYGQDESNLGSFPPDAVVLAETREEVALVLRLAAERGVPVVPRGAGTGMTGGALATEGGIVLSTERMTRIKEIDRESLIAVVEPGVITGTLQEAVEDLGLFYPPDPASLSMCSLGGNVAENAGGPRAFKYGVTREYVLGLEVVLPGGQVLRPGRRTAKGVTGYDVTALFVGSEGTLGITTEVTLKLLPLPAAVGTLLALFRDVHAASLAVTSIIGAGHRPRALELLDATALDHVRPKSQFPIPPEARAAVLIEVDGEPEAIEPTCVRIGQVCERAGAYEVILAKDEKDRRQLWHARRIVSSSLKEAHRWKLSEDVAVPRGAMPVLIDRVHEIGKRHGLGMASYGHAGDGNLHVNVLSERAREEDGVKDHVRAAVADVFRETLALGGTLSGEHGIGLAKRDYVAWEQAPELIEFQRKLKALCDPQNLLNPGKMLPVGHRE